MKEERKAIGRKEERKEDRKEGREGKGMNEK